MIDLRDARIRFKPADTEPHGERGQALVIAVLALIALLAMTALIVDGGNAWAQQRFTQNGSDSAAEAGSVVLVQKLSGATAPSSGYAATSCPLATSDTWDLAVCKAAYGAAARNGVTLSAAHYTNFDGSQDLGLVGGGLVPAGAQGVRAVGTKQFDTYIARVVGVDQYTANTQSTAIVGPIETFCPQDSICNALPVTFPVSVSTCKGNGKLSPGTAPWPYVTDGNYNAGNESILPLCKNGPGSVGWLDWSRLFPNCPSKLLDEITDPCVIDLTLPAWVYTNTGNTNDPRIEDAINAYHNKLVLLPQFDDVRGNGNNLQYHIVKFFGFVLDAAYTNGNNHPECNSRPGQPFVDGNGENGCLKGWWTLPILEGQVHIGPVLSGTTDILGIQLIK